MNRLVLFFSPNASLRKRDASLLTFLWIGFGLLIWQFVRVPFLPRPTDIMEAFDPLRRSGALLGLGVSIVTMVEAIFWTCVLSLGLAYLSVIPAIRPLARFLSGWRRFGLVGLFLFFNLLAPNEHVLKVMLLTFGMTGFYLRDMMSVVRAIPQEEYDHAETLGLNKFRVIYEVVVLGTLDEALESLRVNAAMGWMMLTMVEGIARNEGGIGVTLLDMGRHGDLKAIGVILVILYCVGATQDFIIGAFRDYVACPYARIGRR